MESIPKPLDKCFDGTKLVKSSSRKAIDESLARLGNATEKWFRLKLLTSAVDEVLQGADLEHNQEMMRCRQLTMNAKLDSIFKSNPFLTGEGGVNFLGIHDSAHSREMNMEQYREELVSRIAQHFRQNVLTVHKFIFPKETIEEAGPQEMQEMAETVKLKAKKAKEGRLLLEQSRIEKRKKMIHYFNALMDCASVMEELIEFKLENQPTIDQTECKFFMSKCDALRAKLGHVELQLLDDTYTDDSIAALNAIKGYYGKELRGAKSKVISLEATLSSYEKIGDGFNKIIQEYSDIMEQIENKKWFLNKF